MARIRYIKPEFFSDTRIAELSAITRLLYIGLFCQFDRNGITDDDARLIKRDIFPYDDSIGIKKIEGMLQELVDSTRLVRFEYGGKKYLYCPNLSKHQKFHRDEKPKYAIPDDVLLAASQHPASTLQAMINIGANSTGNGQRVTGNGQRVTGNGEGSDQPQQGAAVVIAIAEFQANEKLTQVFREREVSVQTQEAWLLAYPDSEWITGEVFKALSWEASNPRRRKRDFPRFIGNWLSRGWDATGAKSTKGSRNTTLDWSAEDLK